MTEATVNHARARFRVKDDATVPAVAPNESEASRARLQFLLAVAVGKVKFPTILSPTLKACCGAQRVFLEILVPSLSVESHGVEHKGPVD